MHDRETEHREAIAVVGVACRLPGGLVDLDGLWSALEQGRDLVGTVPADRFDPGRFVDATRPRPGKSRTAAGGFLDDITSFDAAYFAISPKEAGQIDPQQRLLLELTAEALDDAALAPESLAGSDTAVCVGICDNSYGFMQLKSVRRINAYTMTGASAAIAANRLSYTYDLRGPSMAIDTACSSSMVALDRACETLWNGVSRTALCGGANLLLSPYQYIGFSQASMLSPNGRCASFSADADGFVRAEGGVVVVLKTLRDALRDGDRVHGVILGTATNSDGRTLGLALPNPQAQEDLLRGLYARAEVGPDELVYFEAHGTGTPVGDPAEATAVGRALGIRRVTGELPIGSVKSNLGHLEPVSGLVGLCKALLVLEHRMVPASLHCERPHPDIDFAGLGLRVQTHNLALPETGRPVVGVNSFGFGGANAHAVLTAAPTVVEPAAPPMPPEGLPIMVSARTEAALTAAATAMAERVIAAPPDEFRAIAYTACRRRGRHAHRAVVLASGGADAAHGFTRLAGAEPEDATREAAAGRPPAHGAGRAVAVPQGRVAFVFAGNGAPWAGMGADLAREDPAFARAVARVDAELTPLLGWSVAHTLAAPADTWDLDATEVAQPLLFTIQVALVDALADRGVEPDMVLGHSVGEVAAAYCSRALTLAQAARVIVERSRAQATARGRGRMAAVALSPQQARDEIAAYQGRLEIAALNSPHDVTVTGEAAALAELLAELTARGVFVRDLALDYAFHSRSMDDLEHPILTALADLTPEQPAIPFHSAVTGTGIRGAELDARYWWHNVRRPVLFSAAVERAVDDGADILVEIGPHPVLGTYLRRVAARPPHTDTAVLSTLSRDTDGPSALADTHATLIAAGADVDWSRYFPTPGRVTHLPAYPWQRERHWSGTGEDWISSSGDAVLRHPLLGERLPSPQPLWLNTLEPARLPWLEDHKVAGSVLLPATGFVEMAAAAHQALEPGPVELHHLRIDTALVIPWDDPARVRTQVGVDPGTGIVTVTSTEDHDGEPRRHARARARTLLEPRPAPQDPTALRERCPHTVDAGEHYRACAEAGLDYGPSFRGLREMHTGERDVLARYHHDAPGTPYTAHPALLDAALQAGAPLLRARGRDAEAFLPASIGAVRIWDTPAPTGHVWVHEHSRGDDEVCWDVTVTDDHGTVAIRLDRCRLRRFAAPRGTALTVHHTVLRAAPRPTAPAAPCPLPPSRDLAKTAAPRLDALRVAWRHSGYEHLVNAYKDYTARTFGNVLAGLLTDPAEPFDVDDLVDAGMLARHRRLITMLAPQLEHHGVLAGESDGRWRLTAPRFPVETLARDTAASLPHFVVDSALGIHQAAHRDRVLRGAQDPLDLLVSDPVTTVLEQFYDTAPVCRFHNRLAQALLREMVRHWPEDRPLRVLEVGAGTGGTTAALLPILPADRTTYRFTDVSPTFFSRAATRFRAYDFVDYQVLDLNADPVEQGHPAHGFDLVVAVNALHTAEDLHASLRLLTRLLAPGGRLLAGESHDPQMLAPLFGTLESFHAHTDTALRPLSPLLPRERWPALLERCGYTDIVHTGDDTAPTRDHHSVLLATAPEVAVAPASTPARSDTLFLVVAHTPDREEVAHALAERLRVSGAARARVVPAEPDPAAWEHLLRSPTTPAPRPAPDVPAPAATELPEAVDVVVLLGGPDTDDPRDALAHATAQTLLLRAVAAALDGVPRTTPTRLWLVARPCGAVPTFAAVTHPLDAAAWATARCVANEHPDLDGRRVCLEPGPDPLDDARRLADELLEPTDEDEIVLTPRGRFVPRERHLGEPAVPGTGRPFALRVRDKGLGYRLGWHEIDPPRPGPGQVAIEVHAAALNYRDVMQVTGLLPADVSGPTLGPGFECAGVVTACGPGVTNLRPGDRVAGTAPAALTTHTIAHASTMWPIPDDITYTQAATVPVAYATVVYSLGRLARIQPGETVLVHGAAGAVGLAAIQYARAHGAHVIATAGTDLKRVYLEAMGVEHVLDSRTLDFAHHVRELTHGKGVDIVLNSLAGEAIPRSLELLRPGGRFLELGKRDIYANKSLSLRPFADNLAFFGVDLTALLDDPQRIGPLLTEVGDLIRERVCHPLAHSVFPAARVTDAFRLIQHSRHLGKVVVAFDPLDEPATIEPATEPLAVDPEAVHLITGGLGGLGAATAHWLADLGARHLALVGRRGADTPGADELLRALRARGVTARAHAVDATDWDAMRALVEGYDAAGRRLGGVVHCAMHLDDAPLTDLDAERITAVLAPKIAAAMVLDRLTRDRDCDLFLLYSSGTATIGNLTQAPYAAGNLFLEALARRRRQHGRPALATAWGAIGGTGYVARNDLTASLHGLGIETLTPAEAFTTAERLLRTPLAAAGAGRYNWDRIAAIMQSATRPRMAAMIPAGAGSAGATRRDTLETLSAADALAALTASVTAMLADILHTDPERLDPARRLDEYGVDSLMGAELLIALQQRHGVEIPPMELLRSHGTIADIARITHTRLGLDRPTPVDVPSSRHPDHDGAAPAHPHPAPSTTAAPR
ncbi:beta-ketoacyl synthase [Embleya scabrispora]|uniref:Beta-ketoacyl synthase n=1 Tax=Embleya scabrispora TaxID=159449 RepID=A0A1T3NJV8_9ACTN|nr:type I polyketide synthase [Embleya scabrispora]OPC77137.1 beta-ketoacyl synthase [Embleya scabrispora]